MRHQRGRRSPVPRVRDRRPGVPGVVSMSVPPHPHGVRGATRKSGRHGRRRVARADETRGETRGRRPDGRTSGDVSVRPTHPRSGSCASASRLTGVSRTNRPVTIRAEGLGLSRTVRGGWRRTDVTGEALIQERRSGAVATLAASRGTSCSVEVAEYVVRRITGHRLPAVERVLRTMQETRGDARPDAVVDAPGFRTVRGSRVRLQWVATGRHARPGTEDPERRSGAAEHGPRAHEPQSGLHSERRCTRGPSQAHWRTVSSPPVRCASEGDAVVTGLPAVLKA